MSSLLGRFAAPAACGLSAVLGSALALVACGRSRPPSDDPSAAADRTAVAEFASRLTRIGVAAAAVSVERACPEPKPHEEPFGAALVTDADVLRRIARGDAPPASAQGVDPWRPLTSEALANLSLAAPASDDAARDLHFRIVELERRYRHLAVVRADERVAPELRGDRFVAGKFTGWLAVFDLSRTELVCATEVGAASSAEVAGRAEQGRLEVIRRDFALNLRLELDRAAGRLSPALTLDHD